MDSFPAYIEGVGWTVWPRGSITQKQCARFQPQGSIQFWAHDTLPDKKLLVFILDRLQKCATLLPDYDEVIEHPMDFGTVGNKFSLRIKPMSNEQRRQEVNSYLNYHHKPFGVAYRTPSSVVVPCGHLVAGVMTKQK
ncbi:hypothetical protein C4D60_Mb08t13500 [Musa balbisiana]|uniref:Uncharacterized protein n=1 Tax=Musa balbisiana TaxID=52838 RepID=A0A4S8K3I1_MUSBA|nr:hypothetical protein C4D60_Mb08t13500 [Musa balbisiana]